MFDNKNETTKGDKILIKKTCRNQRNMGLIKELPGKNWNRRGLEDFLCRL